MAYVSVHYGPYEAWGVVRHRTQRLRGLKEQLELIGHTVELIPSVHWDRCVIEIARRNVFRCRLSNLAYNTDGRDDVVCHRAMEAVTDAIARMRPTFLYPDIPLFSADFFEGTIDAAFRLLNVREYIAECFESALTYVLVVECIDVAIDEAMQGEYMLFLISEAIEGALQKDYMRDLIETDLQKVFELHDFMEDMIMDAMETRAFMKETITEAITRTHPMIKEYVKLFVETAFKNACTQLNLEGGSLEDVLRGAVAHVATSSERIEIRTILNDLVDELSLRSKESNLSLRSTESRSYVDRSKDSLDKSDSYLSD